MKEKIEEVLNRWNIEAETKQIYATAWAVGDRYILKAAYDLGNLKRNIAIMKVLNEYGVPVASPISTMDGREYIVDDGVYYLLTNKLQGSHVVDIYERDYFHIVYETGKIVARLHEAFLACEQEITFEDNSLLGEMNGWICQSLKANNFKYISELDFEESLEELKRCYDQLPRQLIHRDIHYGNILFHEDKLSGYIDFDLSQKNIRIFDLCYFLIGLLIDHEKNKNDVAIWLHIVSRFVQGYEESMPLTPLEKESICCVMKSIELLFVAYFLDNKDEMLAQSAANMYYFVRENEKEIRSYF